MGGHSANLELPVLARLTGQQSPKTLLSLFPTGRVQPGFPVGAVVLSSGPHVHPWSWSRLPTPGLSVVN